VRLLTRLLAAFGGQARPAQLSQVEVLVAALARGRPFAQTLGGCIVSQGRSTLRLYREPGHHALPEIALLPGEHVAWDWRFRIGYDGTADNDAAEGARVTGPAEVVVRPLGLAAYATLRGELPPRNRPPARAAAGLPSVWSGERLLAVPSLPGAQPSDGRFCALFLGLRGVAR
jgi:tRNA(Ile)-lysidine synthase